MNNFVIYDDNGVIYGNYYSSEGIPPQVAGMNVLQTACEVNEYRFCILNGQVTELPVDLWQLKMEEFAC
jgi:hypothetical protein